MTEQSYSTVLHAGQRIIKNLSSRQKLADLKRKQVGKRSANLGIRNCTSAILVRISGRHFFAVATPSEGE